MAKRTQQRVGVISDTHGLLRPEAAAALHGSDLIIHAGDIGTQAVLDALQSLAPVLAVRGNNDIGAWAAGIPATRIVTIGRVPVCVVHDITQCGTDHGCRVVISGHSHRPCIEERDGIVFLNPGSAGPRRFSLPVSVARLDLHGSSVSARLITLEILRSLPIRRSRQPKPNVGRQRKSIGL
ncbi:MAG TPA: metallophosphoesterase family protein [Nitrospiraceae bacterium]|nr:metallophosphoesterase family protein [Nitrospiraceae bacterium]